MATVTSSLLIDDNTDESVLEAMISAAAESRAKEVAAAMALVGEPEVPSESTDDADFQDFLIEPIDSDLQERILEGIEADAKKVEDSSESGVGDEGKTVDQPVDTSEED